MSFLHTDFSFKKDAAAGRKSISTETTEMMSDAGGLEISVTDFLPVQHPVEPPQGERPVECPMPKSNSSVINEWRVWRRKAAEPTSKRRHSVSHDGDHRTKLLFNHKSHSIFRTSNASTTSSLINMPNQFPHY